MKTILVHSVIYNSDSEKHSENYLNSKLDYENAKFIELNDRIYTVGHLIDRIYDEYKELFYKYFNKLPLNIYIVDHYIPPTQKIRTPTDLSSGLVNVYDSNFNIEDCDSLLFILSFNKNDVKDFLNI